MTATPARTASVAWAGAQRHVLAGDLRATIALGDLQHLRHLYALGPLESLTGEISVFDGVPAIARVRDGAVAVVAEMGVRASFLVYADVPSWHWTAMPGTLAGDELPGAVRQRAGQHRAGIGSAPFAFLIRGVATELVYHVLDKRDGLPHSPERHEAAKVRFALHDRDVEVIGFHSRAHRGIFTPSDSDVHLHFRARDGRTSGHVERLTMAPGWALGLPAAAEE